MPVIWRAYGELLRLEYPLFRKDFSAIYESVRRTPLAARRAVASSPETTCRAVDLAAVLYFRKVLCLQRSAATARLLKKHGFAAELVVGVQYVPFRAHAWVELDGLVINDKPYVSDTYAVLARCS